MSLLLAAVSLLALLAEAPTATLQRELHDDTIYIVHGTPDQLARFQADIGSGWEGGKLLSKDNDHGAYRYWAFPDRTAPQARTFMFGAMMSGLALDIQAYDEQQSFPAERSTLDEIATSCGLSRDPFFITPLAELKVSFNAADRAEAVNCASHKLRAATLPHVLKRQSN